MCGSYLNQISRVQHLEEFGVDAPDRDLLLRPTDVAPVIVDRGAGLEVIQARWGFIPPKAKTLADIKGLSLFNARDDKLLASNLWRPALQQRCVIPASSYVEWAGEKGSKTRLEVARQDSRPLGIAGLWDVWTNENGATLENFTMITTTPSVDVDAIHHRMPAILQPREYLDWLDARANPRDCVAMLRPFLLGRLEARG